MKKTIIALFIASICILSMSSGCRRDVYGCTDKHAANYNSQATINNGSCIQPVYGCTNHASSNYNPSANVDDGSCIQPIHGCTDPNSTNYNPAATVDDGSCVYAQTGQVIFWFDANNGTGTVSIAGQTGTISGFVTGGVPSCGNSVSATFTLSPGSYAYSVTATNGFTWSGTATVILNQCQAYQLH